jgi:hypothetical protein
MNCGGLKVASTVYEEKSRENSFISKYLVYMWVWMGGWRVAVREAVGNAAHTLFPRLYFFFGGV